MSAALSPIPAAASRIALLLAAALLTGALVLGRGGGQPAPSATPAAAAPEEAAGAEASLAKLPLYFTANEGQSDPEVAYYLQGSETSLYFTPDAVTYALSGKDERWAVEQRFLGAGAVRPEGRERTPTEVSYFKGPRSEWQTGLSTYSEVVYPKLWPGIDLVYSGDAKELEYSFRIAPGADPSRVRLAYRGASSVALNESGQLEVETPAGGFTDAAPVAWQSVDGERTAVSASYTLGRDGRYGFELGRYDRTRPLVLDPVVLTYAGFIGGSGVDVGRGIAVDSAGSAYVTGLTTSSEATFPETVGPDLTANGSIDAFIVKVNAAGTGLDYASYIGGSANDEAKGVAVDGAGNAYVTGYTESSEATFPETVGPDLVANGVADAFIVKVNASGTGLDYAGYIGGALDDRANGVAVDAAGNAYVTGETSSGAATFPETVGPDPTTNGGIDAFIAKVNASGAGLVYAGYIGGALSDGAYGVAVDSAGNAYVTGATTSTSVTFPEAVGPDLIENGDYDAFIAKVSASGTTLDYAGYIGGSDLDSGFGVAVDSAGNAYVTGETISSAATFPEAVGPDLSANGGSDAFIARVSPSGATLGYAGFIGGSGFDRAYGVAVDGAGNAYVTGQTGSSEATFPIAIGPDLSANGDGDGFIARVNPSGATLGSAGFIGGAGSDIAHDVAVDGAGNAYVTGGTGSGETTFPNAVGPDLSANGGGADAFIAKFAPDGDGDGVADVADNCPAAANADQANADGDAQGNACDPDDDNDSVLDAADACPTGAANGADSDGDGCKDSEDPDDDNDSVLDAADACALLAATTANGCPDLIRTLTLAYRERIDAFTGKLGPSGACAAAQKVKVFRRKPGPDKRVGAKTTKPSGRFKIGEDADPGAYYATAAAATIANLANCTAVRSKRVRVG